MRPYAIISGDFHQHGGMDMANFSLARHLAHRGHEVHLVAHSVEDVLRAEPNVRVHLVPKPANSVTLGAPLIDLFGRRWARRVAALGGRVVVNGGNCQWSDVNWVHYVHATYRPHTDNRLSSRLRVGYSRPTALVGEYFALRRARLLIANSQRTRDDLLAHYRIPEQRIHVVYCANDPERFRPPTVEARRRARAKLGWPEDVTVVAFIGALGDRRKGFDVAYSAWKALCARRNWDGLLVAVGRGAELPRWRARIEEEGMGQRVHLLGFRTDVPDLLAGADALVSPTRYEPYGLGVQEALCTGLPALVSSSAGIAERYPPELSDLLLTDPENAGELVERLWNWAGARERYLEAVQALGRTLRAYTWDDMARDIVNLVEGTP